MPKIGSDKSLVKIDEASFTEIYNIYWEKVYSISMARLNDSDLAKGIVQEVFKSLWERRDNIGMIQQINHYLIRSAKLKTLEYLRNKRIRSKHLVVIAFKQTAVYNDTENEIIHSNHYTNPHMEFNEVDLITKATHKLDLQLDKGTSRTCVLVENDLIYISINSDSEGN